MKIKIIDHVRGNKFDHMVIDTFLENNDHHVQSLEIVFTKKDDGVSRTIKIDDTGTVDVVVEISK